jgi:hypothetical protein
MSLLPDDTVLGALELDEVYEYYDGPRLFTCRTPSDRTYLAVSIHEDSERDVWLYVSVSPRRLADIRTGQIDLEQAFRLAEDGDVYEVTVPRADGQSSVRILSAAELTADILPAPGERLVQVEHDDRESTLSDVARLASQRHRDAVALTFDLPDHTSEIPIAYLGDVLTAFQELVSAIGQALRDVATARGRIQPEILRETRLLVAATPRGSFRVDLTAAQLSNSFGESLVGDSLEQITAVLEAGSDREQLQERFARLHTRAAAKYRKFLDELVEEPVSLRIDWGSTKKGRGISIGVPHPELIHIAEAMSKVTQTEAHVVEVTGELIGVNVRTLHFEILERKTQKRFSAKIAKPAIREASRATIGQLYTATLEERLEMSLLTGQEQISRTLIALTRVS